MATSDLNTNRIDGAFGTITINDTTEYTVNFDVIQVDNDCKFTTLEINGVSVINDYVADNTAATKPTVITCPYGKYPFSKIKLSEGQVTISKTANQPFDNVINGSDNVINGMDNVIN